MQTNSVREVIPMHKHCETDRDNFDPPPCRNCGATEGEEFVTLTRHHIYPRRFEFGDLVADKVIILCRTCHDGLEKVIRDHERRWGTDNSRSQLPKYMYPHLSLSFIT